MKNFKNMSEIVKAENQKKKNLRIYIAALLAVQMLMLPMSGCTVASGTSSAAGTSNGSSAVVTLRSDDEATVSTAQKTSGNGLSADELFTERDLALFMGMVLLCRCAEIWVFGEHFSDGMKAEIDKAVKRRMTVRYFTENCEEVTA